MTTRRGDLAKAGLWIRQLRESRNLSVREFAARLNVATAAVYDWQSGKSGVSGENAERIAALFGLDLTEVRRNLGLWVPEESLPRTSTGVVIPPGDYPDELQDDNERYIWSNHEMPEQYRWELIMRYRLLLQERAQREAR